MRIPNPVAYRCHHCGAPAVVVEYPTGLAPVHCGTYRATCSPTHVEQPDNSRTLVSTPPTATAHTSALRQFRRRPRRTAATQWWLPWHTQR